MSVPKITTVLSSFLLVICTFAYGEDPKVVNTHSLVVQEKLQLLELIEVTSEKELQEIPVSEQDSKVEAALAELDQLESESASESSE